MLSNFEFKSIYNSKTDNLISEFYIPAFERSTKYDRISAYFDSKILKMYAVGIENIVKNNGKVRFVFSCDISDEDYKLMKEGYELRKSIEEKLLNKIDEEDGCVDLSNLAYLIAHGYVDIKIAFTKSGVFHDKFGIFSDEEGNDLYFRGSNNETVASILNNYESFETSTSWSCDEKEFFKIQSAKKDFEKIWNDEKEGVIVLPIPETVKDKILSFSHSDLSFVYYERENTVVFDVKENNKFIIYNNLDDQKLISQSGIIYKTVLNGFVREIEDKVLYLKDMKYAKLEQIINEIKKKSYRFNFNVYITPKLRIAIYDRNILIDKRKNLGIAIKHKDPILYDKFLEFEDVLLSCMTRRLRTPQLWDAFHIVNMIKSANFSVPGAGKTSIVYGAFAYLSYMKKVDKIVMIGPKNSFMAWKREFFENFGYKKKLNCLDIQEDNENFTKDLALKYLADDKNLILVNYESVPNLVDELKKVIDSKTLLVFDEVHRIKAVDGLRASACLKLVSNCLYKVVLTGTPIPNGYKDIYNMLNILFDEEYEMFFGFDPSVLQSANKNPVESSRINSKIYPFYCRTTKKDLDVPPPCEDDIETGYIEMDETERTIMSFVYREYHKNILLLFIRLCQASSNPLLLLNKISEADISSFNKSYENDSDLNDLTDDNFAYVKLADNEASLTHEEREYIKKHAKTRKIDRCAEIIAERVRNSEKVVAWGIFTNSLNLMKEKLDAKGIKSVIINGQVPLRQREEYIDLFCGGDIEVLIANPHTLAESVSLHKSCHFAIYFEYSYNLTHMVQSRDRIHRLGLLKDQKTEYVYMTLNDSTEEYNTLDQRIYERLKEKEQVMIEAVEGSDITVLEDNYMDDIRDILNR